MDITIDMDNIVDGLVKLIEYIMSEYPPIEAMYNDVFQEKNYDIPEDSYTGQWDNWIKERSCIYEDFICNVLMAVLSDICSCVSIKSKNYDTYDYAKIKNRRKRIIKTKERIQGESLYESQPYLKNANQKDLSSLYNDECMLLLYNDYRFLWEEDERKNKNPLLNLIEGKGIDEKHFTCKNLQNIIDYYKGICKYTENFSVFERVMILYHLEIETGFAAIMQMLHELCDMGLAKEQKEILHYCRGINAIVTNKNIRYQNLIYFGIDEYIKRFADSCIHCNDNEAMEILSDELEIIKCINVIKDTIIDKLKAKYKDYLTLVNDIFSNLNKYLDKEQLSEYEKKVVDKSKELINTYYSFNTATVKAAHFIDMYIPDDKLEKR